MGENPIDDLWNKMIKWLNGKGRVGQVTAKLLIKYRGKVDAMLKKILKTEAQELIKLIDDIKADIIKIIKGGHIDVMDDEELLEMLGNPIEDLWKKMIEWLNTRGRAGVVTAKLLVKYGGKIADMLKKILQTEAKELIGLIEKVKDDVITIIKGGHIDPKNVVMDDEEMLEMLGNPIEDLWKKMIDWLNTRGRAGVVTAKLLVKYR